MKKKIEKRKKPREEGKKRKEKKASKFDLDFGIDVCKRTYRCSISILLWFLG